MRPIALPLFLASPRPWVAWLARGALLILLAVGALAGLALLSDAWPSLTPLVATPLVPADV